MIIAGERALSRRRTLAPRALSLTPEETKFVEVVFKDYCSNFEWPKLRTVERQLVRQMDVEKVIEGLSKKGIAPRGMEDRVQLPASILQHMEGLEEPFAPLVRALPRLHDAYMNGPEKPELSSKDLAKQGWTTPELRRLGSLLREQHLVSGSGSYSQDSSEWQMEIKPAIRQFHDARNAQDYFERVANLEGRRGRTLDLADELPGVPIPAVSVHAIEDGPIETADADRLNFKPYAEALASLVSHPTTKPPLVLSVNGEWGIGKSSLGKMVKEIVDRTPVGSGTKPHLTTWFNAWMHDDADHLDAAMLAHTARAVQRSNEKTWPLRRPLPTALLTASERRKRLLLAPLATLVVIALLLPMGLLFPGVASEVGVSKPENLVGTVVLLAGIAVLLVVRGIPVLQSLTDYVWGPELQAKTGGIARTRSELHNFLEEGLPEKARLVVFVDDLDRCKPEQALRVLEALNQLLAHPRVIVVLMADLDKVAAQVFRARLEQTLIADVTPNEALRFGRDYLEKIVQLQFDVPVQPIGNVRQLFGSLIKVEAPTREASGALKNRLTQWWRSFVRGWRQMTWLDYNVGPKNPTKWNGQRPIRSAMHWLVMEAAWFIGAVMAQVRWLILPRVARSSFAQPPRWSRIAFRILLWLSIWTFYFMGVFWMTQTVAASEDPRFESLLIILLLSPAMIWWLPFLYGIPAAIVVGATAGIAVRRGIAVSKNASEPLPELKDQHATELIKQIRSDLDRNRRFRDLNDSEAMEQAIGQALVFFDGRPRFVKRALNRLRLTLFVAQERGILAPTGPVSPQAVGKWIVLSERWPDVYRAVCRHPDLMAQIEGGNEQALENAPALEQADFNDFLNKSPRLGPVAYSLSRFDRPPTIT